VGYRFISELELGRENPSLETIVLLADGIGCELADFFPRNILESIR
jgi:transcriptional regulator with XRE-family HTH domain